MTKKKSGKPSAELRFHGAAGCVTGSCFRLTWDGGTFLVDCGLFQGPKTIRELNYGPFPFDPKNIGFVLLTHAHIDHSGLIPKLVRHGFTGPVYATAATRDLLGYMLPDSGAIQESEVEMLNKRNKRRGRPAVEPIYTRRDAEAALEQIVARDFDTWFEPADGLRARFWNAGHILGAASVEVEVAAPRKGDAPLRVVFSGDIGPEAKSFQEDPEAPKGVDYLVVESTYGDRTRADLTVEERRAVLEGELADALAAGGNVVIPAFAVERTQELLYDIGLLIAERAIPAVPVYLDSPLAIRATEVFEAHRDVLHDVSGRGGLFRGPTFRFCERAEESIAIGRTEGQCIIIAASGMCEAGRVRHHLRHNLWRPEATVLFVGYQAPGTLGSIILSGEKRVRIMGEEVSVRARIREIDTYSAHADRAGLVDWVKERQPVRGAVFLTHGEPQALAALRDALDGAGLDRKRIFAPKIDEWYRLVFRGRPRHRLEQPRLAKGEAVGADWHNDYAALLLMLSDGLRQLPDDSARRRVLKRMRTLARKTLERE